MKKLMRYLVTALIGAAVAVLVFELQMSQLAPAEVENIEMRAACDGCFVAACLILGLGLLVFVANDGFFTIFSYGIRCLFSVFHLSDSKITDRPSFADYKAARVQKGSPVAYLLIVGLFFLALAFLFLKLTMG